MSEKRGKREGKGEGEGRESKEGGGGFSKRLLFFICFFFGGWGGSQANNSFSFFLWLVFTCPFSRSLGELEGEKNIPSHPFLRRSSLQSMMLARRGIKKETRMPFTLL